MVVEVMRVVVVCLRCDGVSGLCGRLGRPILLVSVVAGRANLVRLIARVTWMYGFESALSLE